MCIVAHVIHGDARAWFIRYSCYPKRRRQDAPSGSQTPQTLTHACARRNLIIFRRQRARTDEAAPRPTRARVVERLRTEHRKGFTANSLTQTIAKLYRGAGLDGATSHSGRRSFLTNLANKGTAIHLLRTLAGHRSISTTATYLYSSPTQLKAAVELA